MHQDRTRYVFVRGFVAKGGGCCSDVKKLPKTCAELNFEGHRARSSTVELDQKISSQNPGINALTTAVIIGTRLLYYMYLLCDLYFEQRCISIISIKMATILFFQRFSFDFKGFSDFIDLQ